MKLPAVVFASLILIFPLAALAKPVKEGRHGIYTQYFSTIHYVVDSITQQCYVLVYEGTDARGIATIKCENLLKRPEWKPIITWVKEAE